MKVRKRERLDLRNVTKEDNKRAENDMKERL